MTEIYVTHTPLETEAIGAMLAERLEKAPALPSFVALFGDLGVGKTAFTRGFVGVLSPESHVKSPTFALVNAYKAKPRPIFHFDMYRIEGEEDLYSIGFYDYLERGICLSEWSENILFALPREYWKVAIEKTDPDVSPDDRRITVETVGFEKGSAV